MTKRFQEAVFLPGQCKNKFQELKSKYSMTLRDSCKGSHSGFGADDLPGDANALDEYLDANPNALQANSFVHFDLMAQIFGSDVFTGSHFFIIFIFTNNIYY